MIHDFCRYFLATRCPPEKRKMPVDCRMKMVIRSFRVRTIASGRERSTPILVSLLNDLHLERRDEQDDREYGEVSPYYRW